MNVRKPTDYSALFAALDALAAANLPQMKLYCEIGRLVSGRTEKGATVAAAEYLHGAYPDIPGFFPRNLRRMRDFYRAYAETPDVLVEAMTIGWTQNMVILEAELAIQEKLWYIQAVRRLGWSKAALTEKIASVATSTEEIGNPVYPPVRRRLAEHGISCDGKTARQLTNADYDQYDLLIGMDRANPRNMHRIYGGDFAEKLHLLMDYTDHPRDVADPWYTGDLETTWRYVLARCQGLLEQLKRA